MTRLVLLVVAIGVLVGLVMPSDLGHLASPEVAAAPSAVEVKPSAQFSNVASPPPAVIPGSATELQRGAGGHFFTDAQVNGMPVHFLVDTGASGVALTTDDAQRIGLQFNPVEFSVIGTGASGPVRGKMVMFDRVTLDGRTVEQVQGAIIEGGEMSLLGQSFLARMGKIEIEGDRMMIR